MTYTLAIVGKGGVGKTTIASLLVHYLVKNKQTPVLVVDADSNTNINEMLGLPLFCTIAEAREDMKKGQSHGMTKDLFIQMRVNQCLVESKGFDLIAMGRPEGAGCYCAANHLLSDCMDKLAKNYKFLLVDNEAGMEHISRITTQRIDLLFLISDPTRRGLIAAQRIQKLAIEMKILLGSAKLIISMVKNDLPSNFLDMINKFELKMVGIIPDDEELANLDQKEGGIINQLSIKNKALMAAFNIFDKELFYMIT